MILANLLSSSKYIIVNKILIEVLGLNEAVILGELCSEYTYWENENQLLYNEYFYSTRDNIKKNTGINFNAQRVAIKNLEEKHIITSKRLGMPCKTYYKINENKIIEYLKMAKFPVVQKSNNKTSKIETTCNTEIEHHNVKNFNINNNNINNNIINNKENTKELKNKINGNFDQREYPTGFFDNLYAN